MEPKPPLVVVTRAAEHIIPGGSNFRIMEGGMIAIDGESGAIALFNPSEVKWIWMPGTVHSRKGNK